MFAIKTVNLRKEYKDIVAVKDLNLEIEEGELFYVTDSNILAALVKNGNSY